MLATNHRYRIPGLKRMNKKMVKIHQKRRCEECFWVDHTALYRNKACCLACQDTHDRPRINKDAMIEKGESCCELFEKVNLKEAKFWKNLYEEVYNYGEKHR